MLRIIAGKHKGRKLLSSPDDRIRPTRESVFNMLMHSRWLHTEGLQGLVVADVCCGTGAFALEALSRGAARTIMVDSNLESLQIAQKNAAHLGELPNCRFVQADAAQLPALPAPCDVLYLDPPYGQGLVAPALRSMQAKHWMAPNALLLVEQQEREILAVPEGFTLRDARVYGNAKITVLQWQATEA
jgi:16S rRNA (guanine966-N2)-methyltransferase